MKNNSDGPSSLPFGKWLLLRFLQTVIAVGSFVIVAGLTVWAYPPVVPFAAGVIGRKAPCSTGEVWRGSQKRYAIYDLKKRMESEIELVERDGEGFELWNTPQGRYWLPAGSASFLPTLLAQQAVNDYGEGRHGVQAGDVVLDCGAHIGVYTRKALEMGASLVVAIEPAPVNLECLRRNLESEIAAGSVILYPKGIWDERAELPLFEDPENSSADGFVVAGERGVAQHSIEVVPIDDMMRELALERVDLIKMDVNGAILRGLAGAQQTLAAQRPRLVLSTEDPGDDYRDIRQYILGLDLGYRSVCGTCSLEADFYVYPEVAFFLP